MTHDYQAAWSYVAALAGDPETAVMDWRAIHDTDKGAQALNWRGTLPQAWQWLCDLNAQGYGIFVIVNATDGVGRKLENIAHIRAHMIDLDNVSAPANYERALSSYPAPGFAVQTSPNKYHVYWSVSPYTGNDRYETVQRKLRQVFDADPSIIDATRVLRVPGFYHMKRPDAPHLVTCWSLAGYGQPTTVEVLEAALSSVTVVNAGNGGRHELGDPDLAAPSLAWVQRALDLIDPNNLDRAEWIAITSAIKQAGWSLTDADTLFAMWSAWCERYTSGEGNDTAENLKQWNSIRNTELGWRSLLNRVPSLKGLVHLGERSQQSQVSPHAPGEEPSQTTPPMPVPEPPSMDCSGPFLTHLEQQEWFKGCVFVVNRGEILTPNGRFLKQLQFNGAYGGKRFIVDQTGKDTKSAWEAATTSTLWTIPKVDHVRFLPHRPVGEVTKDDLGREGVNVYRPANVTHFPGDISPFLRHLNALVPNSNDQQILLNYLAHNVKYPGHKIPWAILVQSAEGAGKGVLKKLMRHAMGKPYVYFPKASELAQSGAKFNKWLQHRLFILVDEIKVDERRELIEVLKPLISEEETEIQAKGVDQDLEDNYSNWFFFSNWKDAVPIDKNGRRWAIMYSPLQTYSDLLNAGMNTDYFNNLYHWLDNGGAAMVTQYLMDYPIERGQIPMRAPETSSMAEAVRISRGPVEVTIFEALEDGLPGFRGGWISSTAVLARLKTTGAVSRAPSLQTLETILTKLGYAPCGRADRAYFQEDHGKPYLFHFGGPADVSQYGVVQGYGG